MEIGLKNNKFEAIKVTGCLEQFSALKRMCGNRIHISYESCSIDDYWLIELMDSIRDKKVVIPNNAYILKLDENCFTLLSNEDFNEYFNIIENENT